MEKKREIPLVTRESKPFLSTRKPTRNRLEETGSWDGKESENDAKLHFPPCSRLTLHDSCVSFVASVTDRYKIISSNTHTQIAWVDDFASFITAQYDSCVCVCVCERTYVWISNGTGLQSCTILSISD